MTWSGLALLVFVLSAAADEHKLVLIRGSGDDLGETPVLVELNDRLPPGDYSLVPPDGGPTVPATVLVDDGKTYLGFVLEHVKKSDMMRWVLKRDLKGEASRSRVAFGSEPGIVRVSIDGGPVTVYRTDAGPKPILFPLIGPTGAAITRSYPMESVDGEDRDHPHQRSFWFTHGNVNGVDFWSEAAGHGTIQETARLTVAGGAAVGVLRTTDDWLSPDGKKICEDERILRFYNARFARMFDFDVMIKATVGPVTFGDTKEGMFGVRVASSLDVKRGLGGKILNAEGKTDADAWGKAAAWVDYAGPVAGKTVGIAILNHPGSFRYPTTWHVRDYGLFAANPFGLRDFGRPERGDHTIPKGGSIAFRYRIILHEGGADAADLTHAFRSYAEPPRVEVRGD